MNVTMNIILEEVTIMNTLCRPHPLGLMYDGNIPKNTFYNIFWFQIPG